MEHAHISPPATHSVPISARLALDTRHAADALHGLPVANFDVLRAAGLLERFSVDQIGDAIEVLIALLDVSAGDPDVETNGDELDGTAGEDDFYPHSNWLNHPGCPISDPGGQCDEDEANTGDGKFYLHGRPYTGAGCPISDEGEGDGRTAARIHQREGN